MSKKYLLAIVAFISGTFFVCSDSVLAQATASIQVTAPNGGECFTPGSAVNITWNGSGFDHVALTYRSEQDGAPPTYSFDSSAWKIVHPVSGVFSYNWVAPTTIPTGIPLKIWVEAHNTLHQRLAFDSSDGSFGFATNCTTGTTASGTVPAAPANLTASVSGSNVTLNWTGNAANEVEYKISRRPSGGFWNLIATLGANNVSYTDSGLAHGAYEYHVNACNSSGCSGDSNIATATVSDTALSSPSPAPSDTTPPVISNIREENVIGSGAQIKWETDDTSDSKVLYGTASGIYPLFSDSRCDAGGSVASHCVNLTNLAASTKYYYKVKSRSVSGYDSESAEKSFTSASSYAFVADTVAPSTPTGITAEPKSSSQINLSWSASTDNVGIAGYKIYRNGAAVATVNGLSYTDSGLNPAAAYNYNVAAFDAANNTSALGATVSVTTFAAVGAAPAAPTNLTATVLGNNVSLRWSDNSNDENVFRVFKRSHDWLVLANLNPDSASFADVGSPAGVYEYRVEACNSNGCASSNSVSVTVNVSAVATSSVEITVTDDMGSAVADVGIRLALDGSAQMFWGRTDVSGKAKLTVPTGTYHLEIFPPYNRLELVRPAVQTIELSAGEVRVVAIQFFKAQKTISGKIIFSNGTPVIDAEVGAYNPQTGNWIRKSVAGDGSYGLKVSGGTWFVNFMPADPSKSLWSWHEPHREIVFASDASAEVKTANFTVPLATARLIVKTIKPDGTILADAGVAISVVSAASLTPGAYTGPVFFQKTSISGIAAFSVAPRTFYIRAFVPSELGLINPDETVVTLAAGEEKTVVMQFKRHEVFLRGIAKLSDGKPAPGAFVWAWSEKGGAVQDRSDASGAFSIPVSKNARWHIGAGKLINDIPYKSSELSIDVKESSVLGVELILLDAGPPLPPSVAVSRPAAEIALVELSDGARVIVPPNAVAVSGNITVDVKPVIEAPIQPLTKVVGKVYDITIKDQSGNIVSELAQETEIVLPYDDNDLKALKITEDKLAPSFYDEKTGAWVKLTEFVVDKVNKKIVAKVKHLTRFALVAAADTVSPAAPTGVNVTRSGVNIVISWVNPKTDFDHAKIYRSTESGKLGTVIFAEVRTTTRVDTKVASGVRYYYTVRAVDPAGNESTNTDQVSGFVGTLPPGQVIKAAILRNLRQGSSGDDVKTLQQKLLEEGVYPEGLITGYFGNLTKQAVIRFQEKYAAEILVPNGLTQGTGFFGPSTRKKMNELIGQ